MKKTQTKKKSFRDFGYYETGSRLVKILHIPLDEIKREVMDENAEGALKPNRNMLLVPSDVSLSQAIFIFLHEQVHDILKEAELDKLVSGRGGGAEEEILVTGIARGLSRLARLNPDLWKSLSVGD